jgi:hypothetical protein
VDRLSLELVSVHYPKAAGSSLAAALKAHFGDALALDYHHDPVNPDHSLSERPLLAEGARAVHGHFRWDRYIEHRGAFRLTFLREPVANLVSIYSFWRSLPPQRSPTHDRFLSEQTSIVDFARSYWPIRRLMSVTYFGGIEIGSFDLVGFYETRVRDLGRLSKQLGLSLQSDIYVNRTAPMNDRQLFREDAATVSTLRSLLSDDVAFYEKARERWD